MTTSTKPRPRELQEVWDCFTDTTRGMTEAKLDTYFTKLGAALRQFESSTDISARVDLTRLWLNQFILGMHFYNTTHIPHDSIKELPELVRVPGTIEGVLRCPAHARVLAFLCLKTSALLASQDAPEVRPALARLLTQWPGLTISEERILDVPHVTDVLYGTAVYDLYRSDVESDADLPGRFYHLRLPVLGMSDFVRKVDSKSDVELPDFLAFS